MQLLSKFGEVLFFNLCTSEVKHHVIMVSEHFINSLMVFTNIITTLQLKELQYPWALRHHLQKKLSVAEPEGKPTEKCYQMRLCCLCFSSVAEPFVLLKYWFVLTWIPIDSLSQKDPCWISLETWTLMLLKESPVEDRLLLCRTVDSRLGQQPLCWLTGLAVWVLCLSVGIND